MDDSFLFNVLDNLEAVSDQIAKIYRSLCEGSSIKHNRTLLDHIKDSERDVVNPEYPEPVYSPLISDGVMKILLVEETDTTGTDYVAVTVDILDIIGDLLRHLRRAVKDTTNVCEQNRLRNQCNSSLAEVDNVEFSSISPKSMLSIRNEQISTLKAILRAHKQTYETDIANLVCKYENEKAIVSEAMMKLRNELIALKQTKESFISLRSVFFTKCDHFITRLNELKLHLEDSEEDVKRISFLMTEMCSSEAASLEKHEDE